MSFHIDIRPFIEEQGGYPDDEFMPVFKSDVMHPVYSDEVTGSKRYARYQSKVRDIINKFVMGSEWDSDKNVFGVKPYIAFAGAMFGAALSERGHILHLFDRFILKGVPQEEQERFHEYLSDMIPDDSRDDAYADFLNAFSQICEPAMDDAIQSFLIMIHMNSSDVTEENYVRLGLPETQGEKLYIVREMMRNCYMRMLFRYMNDSVCSEKKEEPVLSESHMKKLFDSFTTQMVDMSAECDRYAAQCDKLRKTLSDSHTEVGRLVESHAAEKKALQDSLREAERMLSKKDRLLQSLQERYDNLLMQSQQSARDDDDDDMSDDTDSVALDPDMRYVFVADKTEFNSTTLGEVRKAFPDANIVRSADMINVATTDVCVILTKYVSSHSLYHNARRKCKASGIPVIHCEAQNIDRIVDEIKNMRGYHSTDRD